MAEPVISTPLPAEAGKPVLSHAGEGLGADTWQQIFNIVETGIALLDKDFTLLFCNRSFIRVLRDDRSRLSNTSMTLLLGLDTGQADSVARCMQENLKWQEILQISGSAYRAEIFPVAVSANGDPEVHYLLSLTDYSDDFKIQQELSLAKHRAEKAELAKLDFLGNMRHELKTPLNAIIGFSQLMEMEPALTPDQKDNLEQIKKAGDHLNALINEILEMTLRDKQQLNTRVETFELFDLFQECADLTGGMASKNGVGLAVLETGVLFQTDRMRLKQALMNLLSNALRHNRPGGKVTLAFCRPHGNHLQIEIRDSGKGISDTLRRTLFHPFQRLDTNTVSMDGKGMGLLITKHLVGLIGGRLSVYTLPDCGSVFVIDMPGDALAPSQRYYQPYLGPERSGQILFLGNNTRASAAMAEFLPLRPALKLHTLHDVEKLNACLAAVKPDLVFVDKSMWREIDRRSELQIALKNESVVVETISSTEKTALEVESSWTGYFRQPINPVELLEILDAFYC